jgi:hypothetical protein
MVPAVLLGLGVLILAGCFNVLSPSPEPGADTGSAGGGVTIRIAGTPEAARTLYPRAEFSKIELSFDPKSGQTAHGVETLTAGISSVVITGLADGSWEVSAKGFVEIDTDGEGNVVEFEAASSPAVPFTVSGGVSSPASVEITLSADAITSGTPGYFSYSVSFPPGKVDTASLWFSKADGSPAYDSTSTYISTPKDLAAEPQGTVSLDPGYYLVRIQLENSYQKAGRTEIVHIYPNMETRADYTFTAADFTEFIVLSGTVDIKFDGTRPGNATVQAYKAEPFGGRTMLGSAQVQWDGGMELSTGTWEISILPSSSPRDISFDVYTYGGGISGSWDPGVSITVSNIDYPNIPITIDKQTLTLSGTATVTVNGGPFGEGIGGGNTGENISVVLYDGSGGNSNQIGSSANVSSTDGTWSMVIEKPASPTTYYIALNAWVSGRTESYWKNNLRSVPISGADDIPDIDLIHDFTVLSGTAAITTNGAPLGGGTSMNVYLSPNSNGSGTSIGYASVNPDGSWSMALDVTPASGTYYFRVNAWNSSGVNYSCSNVDSISFPTGSYSSISLTHDFTVLSGTATITANGAPLGGGTSINVYLSASSDGSGPSIGYANVNPDGSWSMALEETPASGTYYFRVNVWPYGGGPGLYQHPNVYTISFPTGSYSGINLTHDF